MAEYAETRVLEAALAGDTGWGKELLADFLPRELDDFMEALLLAFKWAQEAVGTAEARSRARDLVALRDELRQ